MIDPRATLMSPNSARSFPTPGVDPSMVRRRDQWAATANADSAMAVARQVIIDRSYYDASSWRGPLGNIPELANFADGTRPVEG